jgi:hypothetical protein
MTYILKFIRNIYIPLLELSVRYLLSATPTPIRYHPAICYSLRPVKNTILDTYLNNLSRYISRIALFMGRREYLLPWVEEREARPAAGRLWWFRYFSYKKKKLKLKIINATLQFRK